MNGERLTDDELCELFSDVVIAMNYTEEETRPEKSPRVHYPMWREMYLVLRELRERRAETASFIPVPRRKLFQGVDAEGDE